MQNLQTSQQNIYVALDNIRSAHNVGSVFRTADAAGASRVYLIGYTPTPIDRFGRAQPDIKKTALGAEQSVSWTHFDTHEEFLNEMQKQEIRIIVVEQDLRAQSYTEVSKEEDLVFIFGNEVEGVSDSLLKMADKVIELPMYGEKESLNVAVAVGVVLYQQRL